MSLQRDTQSLEKLLLQFLAAHAPQVLDAALARQQGQHPRHTLRRLADRVLDFLLKVAYRLSVYRRRGL